MDYFKHYSTASEGNTLSHIMEEFGPAGYAYYFLLLELCAANWDGEGAPVFTFHSRIVRKKLGISLRKLELFLGFCEGLSALSFSFCEKNLNLEIPKLAKIKTTRTVIKSNKKRNLIYIDKDIDKDKDKEEGTPTDCAYSLFQKYWNQAFNEKIESGKISAAPFTLSGQHFENFQISTGLLSAPGQWSQEIAKAAESDFLIKSSFFNALWLIKPENLQKVQQGQYKNEDPKTQEMSKGLQEFIKEAGGL